MVRPPGLGTTEYPVCKLPGLPCLAAALRPRGRPWGSRSFPLAGTLHPNCQDSSGRPRRDIGTILQILNDLLSATRHYQGMPPSLTQLRCHAQCSPASPAPDLTPKTTSCEKLAATSPTSLLQGQSQIRVCKPPGEWWSPPILQFLKAASVCRGVRGPPGAGSCCPPPDLPPSREKRRRL